MQPSYTTTQKVVKVLLLILAVVTLSYLMWTVFEPAVRGADVFYVGAGLDMLKLFVVAVIFVCVLAALASKELK